MPVPVQFHVLSFEGPDAYARAGGIATCVSGMTQALAEADFDMHLWFISDPERPAMGPRSGSTCAAGASGSAATTRPGCTMRKGRSAWTTPARCRRFSYVRRCGRICTRAGALSSWPRSGTPSMPCRTWTGSYAWRECASRSRCSGTPITPLASIASTAGMATIHRKLGHIRIVAIPHENIIWSQTAIFREGRDDGNL
jgi:hypothetical protein